MTTGNKSPEVYKFLAMQEAGALSMQVEEINTKILDDDTDVESTLFLIDQATGHMSRLRSWLVNYEKRAEHDDSEV